MNAAFLQVLAHHGAGTVGPKCLSVLHQYQELQRRLDTALRELQGVVPIFDDILIFRVLKTKAGAVENHDQRLAALLERCRNKGIELNEKKCNFCLSEVSIMGHVI